MDTFFARKAREDAARKEGFHKNEQYFLQRCFLIPEGGTYMWLEKGTSFTKRNGIFVGKQEDIDQVLVSDTFKSAYFKEIEQDIISVGRNHKKNMKKRMNKKNKEANAPPAYKADENIDAIGPSIDDEGPPRYS